VAGGPASDVRAAAAGRSPTLGSADPFGGGREVVIRHAGGDYRLRITHAGKRILTR
jgi:hemin uptake protein HemP